jgi:heat shock protein HslJ
MKHVIICAAAALGVIACAGAALAQMRDSDAPPKPIGPAFKNFPLDQTWSLRSINEKPVPAGLDVSLQIDGNLRGSGYTDATRGQPRFIPSRSSIC